MSFLERFKTKSGYKFLAVALILGSLIHIMNKEDQDYINKFKTGQLVLECQMKDGWEVIDPDKIKGFDDETGYFYFTNGYAKNCEVEKGE